jgi:DNA-directed RNA polymerase specialized sigma24 family protein
VNGLALEQLLDQLPAAQATALRLTVHEGLSLASLGLGIQTHKNLTAALIP